MSSLLELIRETLKDIHIEDGSKQAFDKVCLQLDSALQDGLNATRAVIYKKGVMDGRVQLKAELKELLGVKDCECNDD